MDRKFLSSATWITSLTQLRPRPNHLLPLLLPPNCAHWLLLPLNYLLPLLLRHGGPVLLVC
jgi:hypothetical protein